jgi:hypothetical protein
VTEGKAFSERLEATIARYQREGSKASAKGRFPSFSYSKRHRFLSFSEFKMSDEARLTSAVSQRPFHAKFARIANVFAVESAGTVLGLVPCDGAPAASDFIVSYP